MDHIMSETLAKRKFNTGSDVIMFGKVVDQETYLITDIVDVTNNHNHKTLLLVSVVIIVGVCVGRVIHKKSKNKKKTDI